ncbi:YhdT family protein [Flindersiella endophytica]
MTEPVDEPFEEDPRYAIAKRELLLALAYWAAFTIVVTTTAWLLGGGKEASELTFVLGFPAWFFWSVLVACVAFSVVPYFIVKYGFTDVPLSADGDAEAR